MINMPPEDVSSYEWKQAFEMNPDLLLSANQSNFCSAQRTGYCSGILHRQLHTQQRIHSASVLEAYPQHQLGQFGHGFSILARFKDDQLV